MELESGPDGWLGLRVYVDHVFRGSFGTIYPKGSVDQLVQLATDLCASFLDELLWGGWPMCPDHGTHPMTAMVTASHEAVWKYPTGRAVAKIGELSAQPSANAAWR